MSAPPSSVVPDASVNTRPGLALADMGDKLGPLTDLTGTWIGTGFTLITLPNFDPKPPSTGPQTFRLKLNSTIEILEFTPIGAAVPNRGSTGQLDIDIFGLRYLQRIADAATNQPLHIEPGFWLNVPPTTVPAEPDSTVVRQGTIPHGNSMLALGTAQTVYSGPRIDAVDSTPTNHPLTPPPTPLPPISPEYLAPFDNPPLPPGFELPFVKNPNLALEKVIQGQNISKTVALITSTDALPGAPQDQVGGIVNLPFDIKNANATKLDAIFWIETVQQPDGNTFMQLQYTQTVILNFLDIDWPHISVATLTKQ